MYKYIEDTFLTDSKYYKNVKIYFLIFLGLSIIYFIISMLFLKLWIFAVGILLLLLFFLVTLYTYVYVELKKIQKEYNRKVCYKNFIFNINEFNYYNRGHDLFLLVDVMRNKGINNNKKVEKVIKHYQTLTARNTKPSGSLLGFLALVLSILTIIITDNSTDYYTIFGGIFVVLLFSCFVYFIFSYIIKNFNLIFGKETIYEKLEDLVSEIYMQNLIYK